MPTSVTSSSMSRPGRRPRSRPRSARSSARSCWPEAGASDGQVELVLAGAGVFARGEARLAEGRDHAHLGEALLQVGQRFFVGRVVAFEEELDPAAADP